MIIGISGAQSVGKTTLINEISKSSFYTSKFCIQSNITRNLNEQGYKINKEATNATQLAILACHLRLLESHANLITDRSILDVMVYTHYLHSHNLIDKEILDFYNIMFYKCITKYNIIFYIKPEFPIVEDGLRSSDLNYRNDIVSIFDFYIKFLIQMKLNVCLLQGNVENRLRDMKSIIDCLIVKVFRSR
jgi:deoxyadenosine/deoxycytidine kinase